jgi:hypothetical protein
MDRADDIVFGFVFAVFMMLLSSIRDKLKRIEEKLDGLSTRIDQIQT